MFHDKNRSQFPLLLLLILALTYWAYQPGFSGEFLLDDFSNIGQISKVKDGLDVLVYVFSDGRGPLGRPLSMLSFFLQKESWPGQPENFHRINTLIHLFNGLLVYWLTYQLARISPGRIKAPRGFSLVVTAMWLMLPLLVSSSLMTVQRMTTLASMFMLLGLNGYMVGRAQLMQNPQKAYRLMTVSVALGTLMALLCKEIGVLLPLYIIILEFAWMRSISAGSLDANFTKWARYVLFAPLGIVIFYLAYKWPSYLDLYGVRSFSFTDRLLTEPRALWEYIGQIFLPSRSGLGPFQDDYNASSGFLSPPITLVAIAAWAVVIASGFHFRNRWPLFWLSICWFLGGHVLESTFLPLELYFEHRNYLPAIGPLWWFSMLFWHAPQKIWRASMIGLVAVLLLRLAVLTEVTQTWGQPLLAARLWSEDHPKSVRAVDTLAGDYFQTGNFSMAAQTMLEAHGRIPDDASIALRSLQLMCMQNDEEIFKKISRNVEKSLATGPRNQGAVIHLENLMTMWEKGRCPYLNAELLLNFSVLLLANSHNRADPELMGSLHVFRYKVYKKMAKQDIGIEELHKALSSNKSIAIVSLIASALLESGQVHGARKFLREAMAYAPLNPLLRQRWERDIAALEKSLIPSGN